MRPFNHPTYRFWVTVYVFPAMIPLFLNVAFNTFVANDLEAALGVQGSILRSKISIALGCTFMASLVIAHLMAWWHAATGKPALPDGATAFPGFWHSAGRAVGKVVGRGPSETPRPPR